MKREDISGLQKNRPIYMKIGMLCSLSLVILCFSFTTFPNESLIESGEYVPTEEIEVIRTVHKKKKVLPPPKIDISKTILDVPDEREFIEELPPKPVEKLSDDLIKTPDLKIAKLSPVSIPKPPKPALPPDPVEKKYDNKPVIIAEEMPRFPGCESMGLDKKEKYKCSVKELLRYMGEMIDYPDLAKETNTKGTVVLSFVVELDGSISQVKVVRDIGAGCGREAVRVVKNMPKWSPGKQRGRPVRVKYSLPVKFTLME